MSRAAVGPTYQQNSDSHESSGAGGHGAVHEDDVVLADVFGQTKVMKLEDREQQRIDIKKIIKLLCIYKIKIRPYSVYNN